jgi:hypothetical protein
VRALFILCEPRHRDSIRDELLRHVHASLAPSMAEVIAIDVERMRAVEGHTQLLQRVQKVPQRATDKPLVVAAREVANKLELKKGKNLFFDVEITSAGALTRVDGRGGSSVVESHVNRCGLSVRSAASSMLGQWAHATLDHEHVKTWLDQFARLGSAWIGKALLGQFDLKAAPHLGALLSQIRVDDGDALCVSREPRGGFKSADVIGNMLDKRFTGRGVYASPAEAIELHGKRQIVLFEDGLWSGTEAVGILDSMLGKRDHRLKTARLNDPGLLQQVQFRLAYGIGTDYGQAVVRRALADRGLANFEIACAEVIKVADPSLLDLLADPSAKLDEVFESGPDSNLLRPYVFESLRASGMPDADVRRVVGFCQDVGGQLFNMYLQTMCKTRGWVPWPAHKINKAATGMHGLALAHAFGHSIPKASLPLFWASGTVAFGGKSVAWQPLLPNG